MNLTFDNKKNKYMICFSKNNAGHNDQTIQVIMQTSVKLFIKVELTSTRHNLNVKGRYFAIYFFDCVNFINYDKQKGIGTLLA